MNCSIPEPAIVNEGNQVTKAQYGSLVVISPLPKCITKRNILCRVRGGKVLSCILSKLHGSSVAIVMFGHPNFAQHYVEFCAEPVNKDLWTFVSDPGSIPFSHVKMTAHVKVYNNAPGLGVTWFHEDIPGFLKSYAASTTRCLYLEKCNVERVIKIWHQLGLAGSEHLRNQLDDMWLDGPEWNAAAGKDCGNLHIWYTDIKSAIEARRRCPDLKHETDPCSVMPDRAFILGPDAAKDGSGHSSEGIYVDYHSYPIVSLLDLHKASVLEKVFRGVLSPYEVFWGIRNPQSKEEQTEPKNMTERLMHVLRTHIEHQGDHARSSNSTSTLCPRPGFALQPSGGLEDPFMDGYKPSSAASKTAPQPGYYHTNASRQHEAASTRLNHGRSEPFHQSHTYHGPLSTNMSHAHSQRPNECHPSHNAPAMSMGYLVEDPLQSTHTHPVDPPRIGRLDFKMPRPLPGYTHQFPPPLGGDPLVGNHPSEIAEAMKQEPRGEGCLARRISSLALSRQRLQPTQSVASHNPAHEDTSYQSGRSAGSGRSF